MTARRTVRSSAARQVRSGPSVERDALTPDEARFIEALGLYFARVGVPRIGGKLLGLLMVSEGPISLERMAALLKVSRASISTNMRQFITAGLCAPVGVPGDRRHYYQFSEDAWQRHLEQQATGIRTLRDLLDAGKSAVPSHKLAARTRFRDTLEYFEFLEKEIGATFVRWRRRDTTASRNRRSR